MAKRITVPISTARKQLFQLTDLVRKSADNAVVVLEQRGGVEPVALVREARLAYLETQVAEMHKTDHVPFRLVGSLSAPLDDGAVEEVLRQVRSEWTPAEPKLTPRRSARRTAGRTR